MSVALCLVRSPLMRVFMHTHTYFDRALTRCFNMASRALVPRYPYAANDNGQAGISFCAGSLYR